MQKRHKILMISDFLARAAEVFSAASLALVMLVILIQVMLRFFFKSNLPWAEEVARYLMIWVVMIISSVLVKEDGLIKVDFFDTLWPKSFLKYREIVYQILLLVLFVLLLKEGWSQAMYGLGGTISSLNISWFRPGRCIGPGPHRDRRHEEGRV